MDPDVDMFTLTDESSVKSTLTPRNTETANSVAEEGYSPRYCILFFKSSSRTFGGGGCFGLNSVKLKNWSHT